MPAGPSTSAGRRFRGGRAAIGAASIPGSATTTPCIRRSGAAPPYIVVLVELPEAGGVRMVGNLLGDPMQEVRIGAEVEAAFEHHDEADPPYTLVQWRYL